MKSILLLLFCFISYWTNAQKTTGSTLKGQLADTLRLQAVSNATVSIVSVKDSSLVGFTRTDSSGHFTYQGLSAGNYRLSASQVNFHPHWIAFTVPAGSPTIDLGTIYMKDKSTLATVTVNAQRPPVVVNGDTLEFNAEAFKTRPNAVVEDMLKKMPGVEVDRDGTIRVNGRRISRVLVNGRDFFNGDPAMATRNLPADAVDKMQVFDRQSDQAAFTGVDDGNSERTINLKLKKDKKNALFGKLGAAAGTDGRYDGQLNLNRFNNDQQLSVLGMANNSNKQGFSVMDMLNFTGQSRRMMSGGGGARIMINTDGPGEFGLPVQGMNNSQGITQTIASGINYNDRWRNKTDVNASYFFNDLTVTNERNTNRRNFVPGNDFTALQLSKGSNRTSGNRFNFSVDHKIDSFNSVKLTSQAGYQTGKSASTNNYSSFNDKMLNDGNTSTTRSTNGYNIENNLLFKHKFGKKGRTLSLTGAMQRNDSRANSTQQSRNNYYQNGFPDHSDTLNQVSGLNSITSAYSVNANYTEPLSKRSLVELRGYYSVNKGDLDRKTYDFDKTSGKHDAKNDLLSNAFISDYRYAGGGVSLRTQQKKYGYTIGANLQYAQLASKLKDSAFDMTSNFTDVLPAANFNYNFSAMKSLRIDYTTSTTQPSVNQLQPVQDVSDPLNLRQGNPALIRSYAHNLNVQFFSAQPSKQKNMLVFIGATATTNAIVNNDIVSSAGIRTTTPVNANGVYSVNGNIDRGFRLRKLNTRIGLGAFVSYNRSVNFINGEKNRTGNLMISPRLSASYSYKELLEISAVARIGYNEARYTLQPSLDNNYWRQVYEFDATVNLPWGISISNDLSYTAYTGRSTGYNTGIALWNAAITKQVLKSKKGEIKLSAFDILDTNTGIDRNANSNYVEDISYKTLQQYFTAGFTYSLQRATTGGPRAVIRTF